MLIIEADIHEYVGMSYVDKNILGPLVHMFKQLLFIFTVTHELTDKYGAKIQIDIK